MYLIQYLVTNLQVKWFHSEYFIPCASIKESNIKMKNRPFSFQSSCRTVTAEVDDGEGSLYL